MLHIKHFGYSIAYSRLLFIYTNQIRKNTLTNLRINERMHAHQLTQHNCQRLGCFPFPFGRRLFPFLTTRLMNLPKGKSTGCLLVGTPTRYITRRLGKGWFTYIFLWPAQTIPLTLILFKQHFNQIVLYIQKKDQLSMCQLLNISQFDLKGIFIPLRILPTQFFFRLRREKQSILF